MTPLALPEEYPARPHRTVLVVPHAGGGAAVANPLRHACPAGWLVAGVLFGGRESRFADEPPGTLAGLVADTVRAATELAELTGDAPLLVGQCSGALIAWLAAVETARCGGTVAGIVVVSRSAPSWPGELPDATATDAEFLRQVVDMGGVPADVVAMPELLELLLPSLRADFTALAGWSAPHAASIAPLRAPALALSAPGDPACPADAMAAWRDHLPELIVSEVDGRHLLLAENPAGVARRITDLVPTPARSRRGDRAGTV